LKTEFLCIDFGASRVKWVLYSTSDNSFIKSGSFSNPYIKDDFKVEISISKLVKKTKKIITDLLSIYKIEKILISSQMHGFALMDSKNTFLTDYISWFDQRSIICEKRAIETFKNKYIQFFYEQTGMTVKTGLPYFNSIPTLKAINSEIVKIISLPEIILYGLGVKKPQVHTSIFAGTGFYNINTNSASKDLVKIHRNLTRKSIIFNEHTNLLISHEAKISNKKINISVGYGDHQCSVLGANNNLTTISINMGTGSQVSKIINELQFNYSKDNSIQYRPYFNNDFLKCITHIPSGRVLSNFLNFIDSKDIHKLWEKINLLKLSDIKDATLNFNLAIFEDAYSSNNEVGSLHGITENNLTFNNYISSLIKSYLNQYLDIIDKVEINSNIISKKIILSGGLSKQIKVSKKYFEYFQNKEVVQSNSNYIEDEAILGLKNINKYEN
jgi:sugar (pentulose or hexulose) kinase